MKNIYNKKSLKFASIKNKQYLEIYDEKLNIWKTKIFQLI